ncbi:MAG: ISAs1 family transposase [Candidatus Protochlamydia sp.]|nr:ISAs1 family transposase [Candidatus Protochlamydia sp.]
MASLACLKSTRIIKDKETVEFRYYISSLISDAWKLGKAIRGHWAIENKVHWQLEVSYSEDDCKIR